MQIQFHQWKYRTKIVKVERGNANLFAIFSEAHPIIIQNHSENIVSLACFHSFRNKAQYLDDTSLLAAREFIYKYRMRPRPRSNEFGLSLGRQNAKIHMVVADDRTAIAFMLSAGNDHDAPQGRKLKIQCRPKGSIC